MGAIVSDVDFYLNQGLTVSNNAFISGSLIQGHTTQQAAGNASVYTDTIVDSIDITKTQSTSYLIQIASQSGYEITEIMLVHDNQNSYLSEYGQLSTTGFPLVDFSTEIVNNQMRLIGTAAAGIATVWFHKTVTESIQL